MRIVLADDDTTQRRVIARILTSGGHTVVGEACDGEDGLVLVRQHRPDLVLTDLFMPRRDGISFVRQLRASRNHTPVIMMSGQTEAGLAADAIADGVNAYIRKPFEDAELREAIRLTCGPVVRVA